MKLGLLVSYFIFWNRGGSREGFSAILALVSNGSMKSHEATIAAPATLRDGAGETLLQGGKHGTGGAVQQRVQWPGG